MLDRHHHVKSPRFGENGASLRRERKTPTWGQYSVSSNRDPYFPTGGRCTMT